MKSLYSKVVFPTWHWARGDGLNAAMRDLNRSQWLSGAEIQALQAQKLHALFKFAKAHVPYYRSLLASADLGGDGSAAFDILGQLPPLTKERIRANSAALVSEELSDNRLIPSSTSGSTGEATRFYVDRHSYPMRRAAGLRSNQWTGWRLGDRYVTLWGAPMDQALANSIRGRLHAAVTRHRFLSSYDLSDARLGEYVATIRHFKAELIIGYPGPLELLADFCRRKGATVPSVRAIVSSAETLWPHQREHIEKVFEMKVFDRYGAREFGQIAGECEAHEGLHASAERVFIEIVDDEGNACQPMQEGRLLITDLDNLGMPLIRYEIGDRGSWANDGPCSCGRGLPRLRSISGRTLEIIRTRSGIKVGGTFWTLLLRSRPGLKQIQVVQENLDGIRIRFVRDSNFSSASLDYFIARIRERCGSDFSVEFEECAAIDVTKSGKNRIIISKILDS